MKKIHLIFILLLGLISSNWAYTNITATVVHDSLVAGHPLLLLDVREVSEYRTNHIAEPAGQLPITPASMPWNSGVLTAQHGRLPTDIDIIVYCASGGRSAAASSYLQGLGFTRIYNMTGGFSGWSFERRNAGYGDHSGEWIIPTAADTVHLTGLVTCDTSFINFPSSAVPVAESIYIEYHLASGTFLLPPGVPVSDCEGLYRFTTLDPYGVPLFEGDSLTLSAPIDIELLAQCSGSFRLLEGYTLDEDLTAFVPAEGWRSLSFTHDGCLFLRDESILRRWYNCASFEVGIASEPTPPSYQLNIFPNPFNSKVQINVNQEAFVEIYDVMGRLIKRSHKFDTGFTWVPGYSIGTGLYLVRIDFSGQSEKRKILYLK